MLIGSPIEAELAMDMYPAGLLTCASTVQTAFPENTYSSGLDQFSERYVRRSGEPATPVPKLLYLFASQRSQLRGSGGISPRFPLPDGAVIAPNVGLCQFGFATACARRGSQPPILRPRESPALEDDTAKMKIREVKQKRPGAVLGLFQRNSGAVRTECRTVPGAAAGRS